MSDLIKRARKSKSLLVPKLKEELIDRIEQLQEKLEESLNYAMSEGAALQATIEQLQALVSAARCPCCDNTGAYYDNMGEICQCQWCYEKGSLLQPPEMKK